MNTITATASSTPRLNPSASQTQLILVTITSPSQLSHLPTPLSTALTPSLTPSLTLLPPTATCSYIQFPLYETSSANGKHHMQPHLLPLFARLQQFGHKTSNSTALSIARKSNNSQTQYCQNYPILRQHQPGNFTVTDVINGVGCGYCSSTQQASH